MRGASDQIQSPFSPPTSMKGTHHFRFPTRQFLQLRSCADARVAARRNDEARMERLVAMQYVEIRENELGEPAG